MKDSADEFLKDEIYDCLDLDFNYFFTEHKGRKKTKIGARSCITLFMIERFVEQVASSEELAFKIRRDEKGRAVIQELALAKYFYSLRSFIEQFSSEFDYSEYVKVFFNACRALDLWDNPFTRPDLFFGHAIAADVFNELILLIRKEAKSREVKKKISARASNSLRNFRSAEKYINRLFTRYSRLLVLRVDFGYRKEHLPHITIKEAQKHLEHFLNNRRCNKLFAELVGYIWKLEYGEEKEHHFHLTFFFDGSNVHKDAYLANKIGKYWINLITSGHGVFYNCNADKNKYKNCGIGMLGHSDHEKRKNLLNAIRYLTKKEQYLRIKLRGKCRVFGRGEMPSERTCGAGRPRKETE